MLPRAANSWSKRSRCRSSTIGYRLVFPVRSANGRSPDNLDATICFIAAHHKGLAFPDWLERQLEHDTRRRRAQRLRAAVLTIIVIYNLFLIPDWMLVGDEFTVALFLHFAVVTPWILVTGWLTKDDSSKFLREGMAASIPVAIVLQILVSFVLTNSPNADHYQYFVLLVVLFTNTIQRLPFRYAMVVSSTIIACHGLAVIVSGHMSIPVAFVAITTLAVSAYLTLVSNYLSRARRPPRLFARSARPAAAHRSGGSFQARCAHRSRQQASSRRAADRAVANG